MTCVNRLEKKTQFNQVNNEGGE